MKIPNKIFGETLELSAGVAAALLESGISEGVLLPEHEAPLTAEHVFGRKPAFYHSSSLSYLFGTASNGLRGAAFIKAENLLLNHQQLNQLVSQHLGVVIHVGATTSGAQKATEADHHIYHAIADSGCFQFMASNVQEVIDFTLIAHKIAERSLVPGIVATDSDLVQPAHFPDRKLVARFLGEPDENIDSPTPAQEMIFGDKRRRVPNWFNFDFPVLQGTKKDICTAVLESAAQQQYFFRHLPEIIREVIAEYGELTGRRYDKLGTYKCEDADYVILTQGSAYRQTVLTVDKLRSTEKAKVGCINLSLLRPFPEETLVKLLSGKKVLTTLECLNGSQTGAKPIYTAMRAALPALGSKAPQLVSGLYGIAPSMDELVAVFKNMATPKGRKERFYLGVDFTKSGGAYPQQDILLQTVRRKYPDVENLTLKTPVPSAITETTRKTMQEGLPLLIRRHQNLGPAYAHISRFYHDTTSFYETGEQGELVADPFQALPMMPASTANLAGLAGKRKQIPVFEPNKCTGCGECFIQCPHAALPSIAIGPEALIKGGMEIASAQGISTSKLTPLVKNLGKVAAQVIRENPESVNRVGDFLPAAYEKLAGQMKLEGEKLQNATRDFETLISIIAKFPVSANKNFFSNPEAIEKGTGELFSLAIDPFACTACGICVEACPEDALRMEEQTSEALFETTEAFNLWEQLPDTPALTIGRLHNDENYDSFAALMLSRNYYLSMTGGSASEEGAYAKTVLHLLTSVTESTVQPGIVELVKETDSLIEELSANIQVKLSEALPKETSAALWKAVGEASGKKLRLEEIIGKVAQQEQSKLVDTALLQRKMKLVSDLKELRWVLTEGVQGGGRSRFGLVISSEAAPWANVYPYNSFTSPVFLTGANVAAESALGIVHGYVRHILDNVRLMRRARLEVTNKYNPDFHDVEIAGLDWDQLTDEEKSLVPPLLAVCDRKELLAKEFSRLNAIFGSGLPIKLVVLDNGLMEPGDDAGSWLSYGNTLLFSAMALRNAFVFQGSMGDRKQLFRAFLKGMKTKGPAFFHLHAPEYTRHITERTSWMNVSELALNTRAFASFAFDPSKIENLISTATSLEGTPSNKAEWHIGKLEYKEGDEVKSLDYTFTYADWLFTQQSWEKQFRDVLPEEEGNLVSLAEYLALPEGQTAGKVPFIHWVDADGKLQRFAVTRKVITATKAALQQWNTLRELAGTVTAHPDKLRAEVEKEIKAKYDDELAAMKAEFENKMKQQEVQFMEGVKVKLKEKLLWLSKQRRVES